MKRHFIIRKDATSDVPWYLQETTYGDDRDEYGRFDSLTEAIAAVDYFLAHPESLGFTPEELAAR